MARKRAGILGILGLIAVLFLGLIWYPRPPTPTATCVNIEETACEEAWHELLARAGEPLVDSLGRNRIASVEVTGTICSAAIEVTFWEFFSGAPIFALATDGGLC